MSTVTEPETEPERFSYYPYQVRYVCKNGDEKLRTYQRKYKIRTPLVKPKTEKRKNVYNPEQHKPKLIVVVRNHLRQFSSDPVTLNKINEFIQGLLPVQVAVC
jgi:hypothetical protein